MELNKYSTDWSGLESILMQFDENECHFRNSITNIHTVTECNMHVDEIKLDIVKSEIAICFNSTVDDEKRTIDTCIGINSTVKIRTYGILFNCYFMMMSDEMTDY